MKKDYCVVYAEDDEKIRSGYINFLNMEFERVYGATNGEEAYKYYELYAPDIVILDINMPIMDGLQVAKKIRKKDNQTKIVMLTAYSDKTKLLEAIELNLFKYLIKPVSTFEFRDVLFNIVDNIEGQVDDVYEIDENFTWNRTRKTLFKDGSEVYLTRKEISLLDLFCTSPNNTYSNIDILNHIWSDDTSSDFTTNKIRSLFSKLKTKLGANLFVSIYGLGYKLK